MSTVHTIDCHYTGAPGVAAAYLMIEGEEAAFVETNTNLAVPRLLAALAQQGMTPEQVRWVIITHVHLDHAGGAGALLVACPNATLLAHPRAAPHAIDPSKLVSSAKVVYGADRFAELYGIILPIPASRVRVMADGEQLQWGGRRLTFLFTRGHANHHFVVHDSRENGVFTGDAFGIGYPAAQSGGRWIFPSTSPTDFDGPAAADSIDRIVATGADRAWLTHTGEVMDLPAIAAEMKTQLQGYTRLADEADASGLQGHALEAFCAKRIDAWFARDLAAHGHEPDGHVASLVTLDRDLNAQGIAFAVRKRRYKRQSAIAPDK
jgi:glyoxylase-like metal-dependent hydrolase (beta-lactamase superfamily II)